MFPVSGIIGHIPGPRCIGGPITTDPISLGERRGHKRRVADILRLHRFCLFGKGRVIGAVGKVSAVGRFAKA
jgi:hypothetical protein